MKFLIIVIVTLLTSLAASWSASTALRAKTNGTEHERGLMRRGWLVVITISLIVNLLLALISQPIIYVLMMAGLVFIEMLTIRANALDAGKTEPMANLAKAWLYFGLAFEVGLLYAVARIADVKGSKDLRGKEVIAKLLLCLLPILIIALVGALRVHLVEKVAYVPDVKIEGNEPEDLDDLEELDDDTDTEMPPERRGVR